MSASSDRNGQRPKHNATISDHQTWEKEKKYVVYKVMVNSEGRSWFIFRRYNEFHTLYEKIKKLFPEAQLRLPGKKIFGNLDPSFIQQRREGLDEFIHKLVNHPRLSLQ
ncbi:serine/threonine-protein kinase sgk3 [Plakobranchus ocellatus]|uniref:Serine/threonine-protein kinase sgk3 n=1 Tax=Plakobranchus ocellatus TaxID=259542 RepID=A0AAV4AV72_9GAST|nr:serine/threonine-protein kinase sgk3 [Plakobranchus ocellatus]